MYEKRLIELALKARENAYCPYSGFAVGAALLCQDGTIYTGCNIESAAFGATLCAERGAICNAFAQGCRSFVRGAVISSGDGYCTPCGICRQLLFEFSDHLVMLCCRNCCPTGSKARPWNRMAQWLCASDYISLSGSGQGGFPVPGEGQWPWRQKNTKKRSEFMGFTLLFFRICTTMCCNLYRILNMKTKEEFLCWK